MADHAVRRNRRASKALWSTVMAICAIGCSDPLGSEESELQRMRAVWRETGITDYSYRFQRLCFCLSVDPVVIDVQSGVIVSVVDAETGEAVSPQVADFYLTVDGIFEAIQDAIDRNAHSLTGEYHPTLGYPTSVDIDYDVRIADEEVSYRASDLQAK